MAEVEGKYRVLQKEDYDKKSPDNEIARLRLIEMMNLIYRESFQIGDVIESSLSYEDFRNELDDTWTICAGQAIGISDLGILKSLSYLPDLVNKDGAIGQAYNESQLGLEDAGQNKTHNHRFVKGVGFSQGIGSRQTLANGLSTNNVISSATDAMIDSASYSTDSVWRRQFNGGGVQGTEPDRARSGRSGLNFKPDSIKGNIFIKVNNSRSWDDSF